MSTTGMAKSHYLEQEILNSVLRGVAFTVPATVYLAFSTTPCTDFGLGTEVPTGSGYAREVITFSAPTDVAGTGATGSQCVNSNAPSFPVATTAYGPVTWAAIMDASTAGNMLYYGQVTTPFSVAVGQSPVVSAGSITIIED